MQMNKVFFVVAAFVACIFAAKNIDIHVDCASHVTITSDDSTKDCYVAMKEGSVYHMRVGATYPARGGQKESHWDMLFRCDQKQDSGCWYVGKKDLPEDDPRCENEYTRPETYILTSFEYEGNGASSPCPYPGVRDCMKYSKDENNFVILSDGRLVQYTRRGEEMIYVWDDELPTMDMFSEKDFTCVTIPIDAPEDICGITPSGSGSPSGSSPSGSSPSGSSISGSQTTESTSLASTVQAVVAVVVASLIAVLF